MTALAEPQVVPVHDPGGYRAAHDHLERELKHMTDRALAAEDLNARMLVALATAHGVSIEQERCRWAPPTEGAAA